MKRLAMLLLCGALAALTLTGCSFGLFKTAEELYVRPQLPEEYRALEDTISEVKENLNAEDAAPLSGSNASAIQLLDLDGDGGEESAAAFFRTNAADDPLPLKIYFFRKTSSGSYNVSYVLEGEGNNIYSIAYEDLDGDGRKEVVVSWQLTAQANVLSVYGLGSAGAAELIRVTYNESYSLSDLDGDGSREILVVQRDSSGESPGHVDHYTVQEGLLTLSSSANLSGNITDVVAVRNGHLAGQVPAFYVTSECEGGQITDIFTLKEGGLTNITLNPESKMSQETLRDYTAVGVTDINQDGVPEIPVALVLPNVSKESTATYRVIYWRQFDPEGKATVVCTTYHNVTDGWYLVLPSAWDGEVLVERDDRQSYRGERAVVFYHRDKDGGEPEKFLTIYYLTGDNMETRADMGARQRLVSSGGSALYAAEFALNGWDCGLTMDQLRERFGLIVKEWSTS